MERPHDTIATYVCDTDPNRSRTYPFREGDTIPRSINVEGATFTLRAVQYPAFEDRITITRAVA